ncbi:hypothetical protein EMPS_05426 [Entomortierella parvispora]|uniref:Uncharacterized protein n=1 Tax=Entomortierella parvispora TaxID=205924 RepID=A0A9P3HAZ5_9FUNG|nr:hypothetical protein EMPS_05426 [Entomortierella parvispora]
MQWAIAEWDYLATHEDELSFRKGDHILIQDRSHDEWWEGDCNGLSGVFPANRCRLLKEHEDETSFSPATSEASEVRQPQQMPLSPRPQSRYSQQGLAAPVLDSIQMQDQAQDQFRDQGENNGHNPSDDGFGNADGHEHETSDATSSASALPVHDELQQHHQRDSHASHALTSPPPEPVEEISDAEEAVLLPPNWSATTNASGRLYYYNVLTKETSWKMPSAPMATHRSIQQELGQSTHYAEVLAPDNDLDDLGEEPLPDGWNSAQDEDGSKYFFNETTGEATWDRPMSPDLHQNSVFQSAVLPESSTGQMDGSTAPTSGNTQSSAASAPRVTPKRQVSVDENMLQSQLLGLSLTDEELHALELNQLPTENIQRKGSLRVKSQKVTTNATISSWKDYWVVVYKGFLLFYRDDSGSIKSAYSLKTSADSMSKFKHATQVKLSGCFDSDKISVEIPTASQGLTKKKNVFTITPGTTVRLLIQDASGTDERGWVKDIKSSLASRQADELTGSEEPYLIQILKRQTSGGGETSGLKMNKKIEGKDLKVSKNPLKIEKGRGIRSMVAQGIHVPRRKSAQDEKLRLPEVDNHSVAATNQSAGDSPRQHQQQSASPSLSSPQSLQQQQSQQPQLLHHPQLSASGPISYPSRKSSRDQNKEGTTTFPSFRKDHSHSQSHPEFTSETSPDPSDTSSPGSGSGYHGIAKAKLTNMSRNFFSKDKEKEKEKDKEKDKIKDKDHKDKDKEKKKDKLKDKYRSKEKEVKRDVDSTKSTLSGSPAVFGGSLVVEPGRTVPRIVELCIKAIEARGLMTAGIYRISGQMASIQKMKRAFNEGVDVEQLIEKEPDINTIAALLKLFFRELREPLMVYDFYPLFIAAADIDDYNEKLYRIKELIHSLPEVNFNTLEYLMMHLGRVQDQYEATKMDSANLALVFAPNLLRQEVDDISSIINTGKQSSIIDTLIEQREWVFDPYPPEEEEEEEEHQQQQGGAIVGEDTGELEDPVQECTPIQTQGAFGKDALFEDSPPDYQENPRATVAVTDVKS